MGDTLESVTLGHSDDIHGLVLGKHVLEEHGLLEQSLSIRDLVGNRATVDLDLHQVSLLLADAGQVLLGVDEDTDDSAILANTLELLGSGLGVLCAALSVLGEGLLLAAVPVAVESALEVVGKVIGPDSGEGAETARGFDVANDADDDHWWCLDNRDAFDDFPLVHLCCGVSGHEMSTCNTRTPSTYWSLAGPIRGQCGSCQPCSP